HTGAIATTDAVCDGVLRQAGIVRVHDEEELLDTVSAFAALRDRPIRGARLGLVTQSGGAGVLMADRSEELGLDVPKLQPETHAALRDLVPVYAGVSNPVDVTAQFIAEPRLLEDSL